MIEEAEERWGLTCGSGATVMGVVDLSSPCSGATTSLTTVQVLPARLGS